MYEIFIHERYSHDVRFLLAKNEWNIRSDVTIKKKPITIKAVSIVSASSTPFIYISISYFNVTSESMVRALINYKV